MGSWQIAFWVEHFILIMLLYKLRNYAHTIKGLTNANHRLKKEFGVSVITKKKVWQW